MVLGKVFTNALYTILKVMERNAIHLALKLVVYVHYLFLHLGYFLTMSMCLPLTVC